MIAKSSLDELLWHLIKKKFRNLGEFVEGKEKMEIVVHRRHDDETSAICAMDNIPDEDIKGEVYNSERLEGTELIEKDIEQIAITEMQE